MLERIADEQMTLAKDGNAKVIPATEDKRCLLSLTFLEILKIRLSSIGRRGEWKGNGACRLVSWLLRRL